MAVGNILISKLENPKIRTTLSTVDSPTDPPRVERRRLSTRPTPSHRQWTPLGRALAAAGDNWTLAIITELGPGRTRLSTLRERLAGVSAAVLDRYLQRMGEAGLVRRERYREMPPRVELELTEAGRELLPIATLLTRWGLRWAWSEPLDGEIVDLNALLRSLPSMIDDGLKIVDCAIELVIEERGGPRRHLAIVERGSVRMHPGDGSPCPEPTATIRGDWRGWSAAIGPDADIEGLVFSGRTGLAEALLAAVVRPALDPSQDEPADVGPAEESAA